MQHEHLHPNSQETLGAPQTISEAFNAVMTTSQALDRLRSSDTSIYQAGKTAEPLLRSLDRSLTIDEKKDLQDVFEKAGDLEQGKGALQPSTAFNRLLSYSGDAVNTPEAIKGIISALDDVTTQAITDGRIDPDKALEVPVKIKYGSSFFQVTADIYSQIIEADPEIGKELEARIPLFASPNSHRLYVTRDSGSTYMSDRNDIAEVVLSEDSAKSSAIMLEDAFADAGYDKFEIEKALGIDLPELGARYIYAHELGHVLAAELRAYRINLDWEGLYLMENPSENLVLDPQDTVSAEKERFAEGIARLYLQNTLVRAGLDDSRIFDIIDRNYAEAYISGATEAFDALEEKTSLGTEVNNGIRYNLAARFGYGNPLSWNEIHDRLKFVLDPVYTDSDKRNALVWRHINLTQSGRWGDYISQNGFDQNWIKEQRKVVNAAKDDRAEKVAKKDELLLLGKYRVAARKVLNLARKK